MKASRGSRPRPSVAVGPMSITRVQRRIPEVPDASPQQACLVRGSSPRPRHPLPVRSAQGHAPQWRRWNAGSSSRSAAAGSARRPARPATASSAGTTAAPPCRAPRRSPGGTIGRLLLGGQQSVCRRLARPFVHPLGPGGWSATGAAILVANFGETYDLDRPGRRRRAAVVTPAGQRQAGPLIDDWTFHGQADTAAIALQAGTSTRCRSTSRSAGDFAAAPTPMVQPEHAGRGHRAHHPSRTQHGRRTRPSRESGECLSH